MRSGDMFAAAPQDDAFCVSSYNPKKKKKQHAKRPALAQKAAAFSWGQS
jgi:hypothetical protein